MTFDKNKNKNYSEIEDLEEEDEKNGIKKDKKMNNNLKNEELSFIKLNIDLKLFKATRKRIRNKLYNLINFNI